MNGSPKFNPLFAAACVAIAFFATSSPAAEIPKMVDLGAGQCIPCKMMAPIIEDLEENYSETLEVEFIDVWMKENVKKGEEYGIESIPTQIFLDSQGKELWRHVGFISKEDILAKWKALGYEIQPNAGGDKPIERWTPLFPDPRPKDQICYICDGDISEKTMVKVEAEKGDVRLCSLHCYFIMRSCLTSEDPKIESKTTVADWKKAKQIAIDKAIYLYGADPQNGRPWIRAFGDEKAAKAELAASGGDIIGLESLKEKELATTCGFCDRAVYPADAAEVMVGDTKTYGCCAHCALGVAARTGKDIVVHQPDALTGDPVVIKTSNGRILSIDPEKAVAWFGMRQTADGEWKSAGCFHQANFTCVDNLKKWLKLHGSETGKQISIEQALSDKMKLTPEQIGKACKIGECAPK